MKTRTVKALQQRLTQSGHYAGTIDGDRGPRTNAAVAAALAASPDAPKDSAGWSDLRKAVALLQLWAKSEGFETGEIDGLWGPQTEFAVDSAIEKSETGRPPEPWRDRPDMPEAATRWPREADLTGFFGPPGVPNAPAPARIVKVRCPWKLKIAWQLASTRTHFNINEKCADSLATVLEKVHATYGDAGIARLGLDIFGGDYNARLKRGGRTLSTHSWGIAIDFDPTRNGLKANHATAAFAKPDYEDWWRAWESEGWVSLGRARNFDWMHVQAARL